MANVYYSDQSGTNLNVFEKKTKGGEPFYYIYLNKNLITDADVEKLVKIIENSIANKPKVKQKKGKLAYQITWSFSQPTPLATQQILFDVMFKWLKDFGYVDSYQAKAKNTTTTQTTTTSSVDDVEMPDRILEVGDEFYFNSFINKRNYKFNPIYKIVSITNGMLNIMWLDERGIRHDLDGWTNTSEAQRFVKEGNITFPTTSSKKRIKPLKGNITFPPTSSKKGIKPLNFMDFFRRVSDNKLYVLVDTDSGSLDVDDDEDLFLNYESAKRIETLKIKYEDLLSQIDKGDIEFLGSLKVGDSFKLPMDINYLVKNIYQNIVSFEVFNVKNNQTFGLNNLPLQAFFETILTSQGVLDARGGQKVSTTNVGGNKIVFDYNDIIWNKNIPVDIIRVLRVDQDRVYLEYWSEIDNEFKIYSESIDSISSQIGGDLVRKKLQVGDVFRKDSGLEYKIIRLELVGQNTTMVYYEDDGNEDFVTDMEFIQAIQERRMKWITTDMSMQVSLRPKFQLFALFQSTSDKQLFRIREISAGGYYLKDTDKVYVEGFNKFTNKVEISEYDIKTFELFFSGRTFEFIGNVKVGDKFSNDEDTLNVKNVRIVTSSLGNDIEYETWRKGSINTNDYLTENGFTDKLITQNYKFEGLLPQTLQTIESLTPPTSTPTINQKPKINNREIDALKKELSDLLFLKSGISDLDFEDKINISTEIYDVQTKIDDLNEKLFEERVGDEQFFDKLFEQSFTPLRDRYDLIITPNELDEILSPSGEKSDLNEDLQVLVNSKDFKDWFGDWRNAFFYRNLPDFGGLNISKVLNDKFEPQIVWHGTNNEFSYFDFQMFPANYFAVNKEYSEFFATNKGGRGYVLPFFLDIKNPLDLSDFGIEKVSAKDFFDWMFLMTGMTPQELEVMPIFLEDDIEDLPIWMYIRNNATMLEKIAKGRVYDGIKFYEYNPNEENNPDRRAYETLAYIIFDPHQAKLADPTRGEILLASLKSFMLKQGGKI